MGDFEYEEGRFILNEGKVRIYFGKGYNISNSYLVYYRQPAYIDMRGYKHFDGTPSIDIDPELDDYNCDQVLNRMALEVSRIDTDAERAQMDSNRIDKEF